MTELFIYNQDDQLLTIITEDTGLVSAPVRIEVNSVPDTPFSFTVEADSENAKFVKEENKTVYRDHEGDLRLVVIRELDDSDSMEGPLTTATCEPEFMELAETFVLDRRFTDRTAQYALDVAIENTGWIGEVEVELGLASTNFYRLRVVDAVFDIIATWGGEFKDVVEFDEENNIIARKIKIIQRLGADTGQRFEIDHNITEIGRTVLSYPVTAMYGWGASLETDGGGHTRYIDFGEVEWKKSNGDPVDKPKGQMWVGDPEAFERYKRYRNGKWIHRYGEFSNQDYEDPEELLWVTWNNLQANKYPEVNYRLSVDLFDDEVSLGDTAIAIDRYFSRPIEIQARIIAMEYDLLDIEGTMVVEMGQFLNLDDERLNDLEREVEKLKNHRPSNRVTEDSYPDRKPSTPVNVKAVGAFETIQLYWDYADEIFIKHYEVYGSQVADFVPDSQHLLWRGQVSAFGHTVNTDETWYYYVRAVNYHGTASDWSVRVSASTVRIISNDIMFGPGIASELRELSKTAQLLADGTVDLSMIADDVTAEINAAKDEADNAQARAEDAYNNAQTALNNAQTAFDEVQDALLTAGNADRIANTAHDLAIALNTTVSGHSTQITDIEGELSRKMTTIDADAKYATQSQLTATSEQFSSDILAVQDAVDGLEIGGRNLILNSEDRRISPHLEATITHTDNVFVEEWGTSSAKRASGVGGTSTIFATLPSGRPTESIRTKDGQSYIWNIYIKNNNNQELIISNNRGKSYSVPAGVAERVIMQAEGNGRSYLQFNLVTNAAGQSFDFVYWHPQIEEGNKATDWTPAPEDIQYQFSSINQTVDSITERVGDSEGNITALQTTATGFARRIENAEGDISTLSNTAQGLQNRIANAEGDISSVTQLANTMQTDLRNAEGDINTLTQTASSLDSTIKSVRDDLDGLEIGGRNLYIEGRSSAQGWGIYNSTRTLIDENYAVPEWGATDALRLVYTNGSSAIVGTNNIMTRSDHRYIEGDEYIATGYIKNNSKNSGLRIASNGNGVESLVVNPGEATFFTIKMKLAGTANLQLNLATLTVGVTLDVALWNIMIIKGNKAVSDYYPAYEDLATQSQFTQLSDNINARVQKGDVINQINISTEGILIDGRRTRITGQTTIDNAVIKTAHIADAAINSAKIADLAVETAAIANAAIAKAHLQQAIIDDAHIDQITGRVIAANSITTDHLSVTNLAAISSNLGTVTAGILRSGNTNTQWNLNTGNLTMNNNDITFQNGANINFESNSNTLTYRKYDSADSLTRSAGVGVGDRIGGRYPFAFLGTTGASNLDSLSQYFSGFIANSTAATGEDNAANSVNGWIFQMRNRAVGWDRGIGFNFNGNPDITMINGGSYDYTIGPIYQIRAKQQFNVQNYSNGRSGWLIETEYSGEGRDITFGGQYGADYNYQIGRNSSVHAIRNIYLRNNPIVVSDMRAKEDITSNTLGLEFINSIDTKLFRLKQKPSENERNPLQFGFIAQDLLESLSNEGVDVHDHSMVGMGEDGLYNLKETQLIAPTVKAVQDLDEKVVSLQSFVDDELNWLKTENQLLRNKIKILEEKIA